MYINVVVPIFHSSDINSCLYMHLHAGTEVVFYTWNHRCHTGTARLEFLIDLPWYHWAYIQIWYTLFYSIRTPLSIAFLNKSANAEVPRQSLCSIFSKALGIQSPIFCIRLKFYMLLAWIDTRVYGTCQENWSRTEGWVLIHSGGSPCCALSMRCQNPSASWGL